MAGINAHAVIGPPRRYGGINPDLVAFLRDAGPVQRWQVENLNPDDNGLPKRTVVVTSPDGVALGFGVALATATDSPFLNALIDPADDGFLHLDELDPDKIEEIAAALAQNPTNASVAITWFGNSVFNADIADHIVRYVSGDIYAATTIWEQTGTAHDGFGTPGQRHTNPVWGA